MAKGVIHGCFISLGYDYFINAHEIYGILGISQSNQISAPIERMLQQAEKEKKIINLTNGHKTKSIVLLNNDMIVRSALSVHIIAERIHEAIGTENANKIQLEEKIRNGRRADK